MFRHEYPTGTCRSGNAPVRSCRDNIAGPENLSDTVRSGNISKHHADAVPSWHDKDM